MTADDTQTVTVVIGRNDRGMEGDVVDIAAVYPPVAAINAVSSLTVMFNLSPYTTNS